MRQGRIVAKRDAQRALHDTQQHVQWKLPYAAVEPTEPGSQPQVPSPAPSSAPKPTRADKVSFSSMSSVFVQVQPMLRMPVADPALHG